MRLWWSRVFALTKKELLQFSRDVVLVFAVAWFFTAEVFIAGSGVTMDLNNAPVVIMDHDRTEASREWISQLKQPYYNVLGQAQSRGQANEMLDKGDVLGIFDIPPDFQKKLLNQQQTSIQLQLDASNIILGTLASSYSGLMNAQYNQKWMLKNMKIVDPDSIQAPIVEERQKIRFNPEGKSTWFMPISEMMTVITLLSLFLPAAIVVREKERGTIEQLSVAPLSTFQILFPKILAAEIIILVGVAVCIFGVVGTVFQVPFRGSLWAFFFVTMVFVYAVSGLGLFISSVSRNLGQALMVSFMLLMPMLLLSGAWTPRESMPDFQQYLMFLSPLSYYIDIGYSIILKGASMELMWLPLLEMFGLGTILFWFGLKQFHRQFS